MRTQIRRSVFETNSSSSHSVTVSSEELAGDFGIHKALLRDGVIRARLQEGGYGWEWHRYYSPGAKIAYLVAQLAGRQAYGTSGKDISGAVRTNSSVDALLAKIEKSTGCRVEVIGAGSCPIDHDSVGVGVGLLHSGDDGLLRFIFGKDSFLETGNDNSEPPMEIATDRGSESYHANRVVEVQEDARRFDLTLDRIGNVFLCPEGEEPLYANVDDRDDFVAFMGDLDGLVVEKVSVWSQRPVSMSEEHAVEDAGEFVHCYLRDLTRDLPALGISKDMVVETAFDVSARDLSDWDRKESAQFTISAATDPEKLERMMVLLSRHSGMCNAARP